MSIAVNKKNRLAKNYDRAAWFYEASANVFSAGRIRASKRYQLNHIEAGEKVLFLGVGAGEDAVLAARKGAKVTCIDISRKMLDRLQRKLDEENLAAELVCESAFEYERFGHFDVCAANYFLNVFRKPDMKRMMNHAATLVRPGGKFLIADVALPQGNLFSRVFNLVYLKAAMASFCAIGLVPWHENYDYVSHFADAGLKHQHTQWFRFVKVGPIVYQSIVATKA